MVGCMHMCTLPSEARGFGFLGPGVVSCCELMGAVWVLRTKRKKETVGRCTSSREWAEAWPGQSS